MNINTDNWCRVALPARNQVEEGPRPLPAVYQDRYNFNDDDHTIDAVRNEYGWLLAVIIPPIYDTATQYLGDYLFTIYSTYVDVERTIIDKSQEQIDREAPISAVNWENVEPNLRQWIDIPYQSIDRLVIERIFQTWNTPDDIFALACTLYTESDATGMSVKVHLDDGTYLYTMALEETAPGSDTWYAETHSSAWGQHLERKSWRFFIFKAVDLTPEFRMALPDDKIVWDVKWNVDNPAALGG